MIKLHPEQNMTVSICPRQLYRPPQGPAHTPHTSLPYERGRRSLLCPGDHVSRKKPSPWAEPSRELTGLLERRGLPGKRFWKEESLLFRENLSGSSEITEQRESRSSWSPGCLCPGAKGKLNLWILKHTVNGCC